MRLRRSLRCSPVRVSAQGRSKDEESVWLFWLLSNKLLQCPCLATNCGRRCFVNKYLDIRERVTTKIVWQTTRYSTRAKKHFESTMYPPNDVHTLHFLANDDSGWGGEREMHSRGLVQRFFQLNLRWLFHLGPLDCATCSLCSSILVRVVPHVLHIIQVGSFANVHDWQVIRLVVIVVPVRFTVVI